MAPGSAPCRAFNHMNEESSHNNLESVYHSIVRLITLQIDYARLTAAEKATILLSAVAGAAIAGVLITLILIFVSIGLGQLLHDLGAGMWAYFYVAAFYAIVLVVFYFMRKKLIINPIARFLSALFVKPPKD